MKINKDCLFEILNGESDEYELMCREQVGSKHSDVHNRVVFKKKNTELYYEMYYWRNYEWGVEEGSFELDQVTPREVTTIIYER